MAQGPELLVPPAAEHLAHRPPDRRLAGEAQVVLDAEVLHVDGVFAVGLEILRGQAAAHRTFAKLGSRRLKTIVVRPSRMTLAIRRASSALQFGAAGCVAPPA